jgi:CRP/FNR family transcriptional regulator, cyclic AMP receptor protein
MVTKRVVMKSMNNHKTDAKITGGPISSETVKVGLRMHCSSETLAEMLDQTRWAMDFSWEEIKKLSEYMRAYEIPTGQVIFREGDIDRYLGVLLKGSVEIYKKNAKKTTNKIATVMAPQSLGEMSLLDGGARSAMAKVKSDVLLIVLSKDDLNQLSEQVPALAYKLVLKIAQLLSQRLRQTSGQLVDFLGVSESEPLD